MKYIIVLFRWTIIIVLSLIPTIYFFQRITDSVFVDNAIGNWFATMIGALVGIVIAVEINRWGELQKATELQFSRKRQKKKVLELLGREIGINLREMNNRQSISSDSHRNLSAYKLKDELWRAFSDGGDLKWIDEVDLLEKLANVYYLTKTVNELKNVFDEVYKMQGLQQPSHQTVTYYRKVYKDLSDAENEFVRYGKFILDEIERKIKML